MTVGLGRMHRGLSRRFVAAALVCWTGAASASEAPDPFAADLTPVRRVYPCGGPSVELVSRGLARRVVVTEPDARSVWAANYLADCVRRISGVKPRVAVCAASDAPPKGPALYLGNRFADVPPPEGAEAFRVRTRGGSVYFLGRADYAAFDWTERALGVRFYWAEENGGWSGPSSPGRLAAPALDYEDAPVFEVRENYPYDDAPWNRVAKGGRSHRGRITVHAPHRWHKDASVYANHPDIFALTSVVARAAGEAPSSPMLCYGNPETLAYYRRRIDEQAAGGRDSGGIADSRARVISVSPWDLPYECRCPWCRTLRDQRRGLSAEASPIVWGRFLKRLSDWAAARHPDWLIVFLPYWNYTKVPPGLSLAGNCEAMVCTIPGLAKLKSAHWRTREEGIILDWERVTGRKVVNWHYSCWPGNYTKAPFVYGRTIAGHYRRMRDHVAGSFICGGTDLRRFSLSLYVWMRCLWNPDVDVGAVYEAFCARMFGPAAAPMRELIEVQETAWEPDLGPNGGFPAAARQRMCDLLNEAVRRASASRASLPALRYYLSGFDAYLERK